MLSRAGNSRRDLVCSDCGAPIPRGADRGGPHPLVTGLTLVSMGTFALLLFFLTNWRPQPVQQAASQRAMTRQITTGAFERDPELIEKGVQDE
jgi:uncharacterized membrane protein